MLAQADIELLMRHRHAQLHTHILGGISVHRVVQCVWMHIAVLNDQTLPCVEAELCLQTRALNVEFLELMTVVTGLNLM